MPTRVLTADAEPATAGRTHPNGVGSPHERSQLGEPRAETTPTLSGARANVRNRQTLRLRKPLSPAANRPKRHSQTRRFPPTKPSSGRSHCTRLARSVPPTNRAHRSSVPPIRHSPSRIRHTQRPNPRRTIIIPPIPASPIRWSEGWYPSSLGPPRHRQTTARHAPFAIRPSLFAVRPRLSPVAIRHSPFSQPCETRPPTEEQAPAGATELAGRTSAIARAQWSRFSEPAGAISSHQPNRYNKLS